MIHFKLKDLNTIQPAGEEPNLSLSWFYLTDGELWLTFGSQTIYEYSPAAIRHFGDKPTPYNDYYIVRFLEDLTELFEKISISVPANFYKLTADLHQFKQDALSWLDRHDTEDNEHSEFYIGEYDKLISWTYERELDSGHLIGGPHLSFFRHHDNVRITWTTEHRLENGIELWTAKYGSCEMAYADFVDKVKAFSEEFFAAMDQQIALALAKDWGAIKLDKARLKEEHLERKLAFDKQLLLLEHGAEDNTNWTAIVELYNRMMKEIS